MALKLFHRAFGGEGRPIVILHGLFGSHKNWMQVAGDLHDLGSVYGVDLRNHGDSPHGDSHTFEDLLGDLDLWTRELPGEEAPILVGHSMGGLAAMGFTLRFSNRVHALAVVDIAPRAYEPHHHAEFQALEMDVSGFESRAELDKAMARILPDAGTRQFLQMNLDRVGSGYRWKINVPVLKASRYIAEFVPPAGAEFAGPVVHFSGGKSDYVRESDRDLMRGFFPEVKFEHKADADHWMHYTSREWFTERLREFLRESV